MSCYSRSVDLLGLDIARPEGANAYLRALLELAAGYESGAIVPGSPDQCINPLAEVARRLSALLGGDDFAVKQFRVLCGARLDLSEASPRDRAVPAH
jgi:hypothetical protein